MKSFLTLVFRDFGAQEWFTDELFDEAQARFALKELGVPTPPGRRVRFLRLELPSPLTAHQQKALVALQEQGLFSTFFLLDDADMCKKRETHFMKGVE
jgi:hypothetical protein